jgi:hypothetical protein
MTIVFNKQPINLSQIISTGDFYSYLDKDPKTGKPIFNKAKHKSKRDTWVRAICVHTNRGEVGPLLASKGPSNISKDISLAKYQASSDRVAGWDYTVDYDGSVACSNDPFEFYTYHAGTVNRHTVGIEMVQETNEPNGIYNSTLDATVQLIDVLTFFLGIQRQVLCYGYEGDNKNKWIEGVIPGRLQSPNDKTKKKKEPTGFDCVGIYGHRNVTKNKGPGDPGNLIFDKLREAGYELFDASKNEDLEVWKLRQKNELGMDVLTGVAGPKTRQKIFEKGISKTGLWVERPIDKELLKLVGGNVNGILHTIPFGV